MKTTTTTKTVTTVVEPALDPDKPIEVICVIDTSGSMGQLTADSVGTFNSYIEELKEDKIKARVTLIKFDNTSTVVFSRVKLKNVEPVTQSMLRAGGMTALTDALGAAITNAKPGRRTICLVQTDGHENVSSEYTTAAVKAMVEAKMELGWDFLFTGVGIDGFSAGGANYGLTRGQTMTVKASGMGMQNASVERRLRTRAYAQAPSSTN